MCAKLRTMRFFEQAPAGVLLGMSLQNAAAQHSPAAEFKGSVFTLTILLIRRLDLNEITSAIQSRLTQAPGFFLNAPVVLDLAPVSAAPATLDFVALTALLRAEKLVPVGVVNGSDRQHQAAIGAGLALLQDSSTRRSVAPKALPKPTSEITTPSTPSKMVTQPVRSGQQVYAKGGDLILLAAVNAGAEVIADGSVHVYAPLRGRALAGVQGDKTARIFTLNFGAEMVAIAGHYRVFEEPPSSDVLNKPAHIALNDETLLITSMN